MQKLLILQSMWAMERRHTDGLERSLEENVEMIVGAGFDGVSMSVTDTALFRRAARCSGPRASQPKLSASPRPSMTSSPCWICARQWACIIWTSRPMCGPGASPIAFRCSKGGGDWPNEVDFPVYFETHRDRMTTDLYFTLDLLECFPDLKLIGDLSHFMVGREFSVPISEENHGFMHQILDHCWAFHGRVASREQVQIEISFPHHRPWLDIFLGWWDYGFRSWRRRAGTDESLAFVCELGPKPYAITGPDGNDTTDRWREALLLKDHATSLWDKQ